MAEKPTTFRIGYAFEPKKVDTFMQPALLNLAKERGIDLIPIEFDKPLIDQGPFDCVIHKSYDSEWTDQLQELRSRCPNLVIIDEPVAIQRLHNRKTMLQVIDELKITSQSSVKTPYQVFVESPEGLLDCQKSKSMEFPVIAKPLMANGSVGSHQMYLVFEQEGLGGLELEPPFVLQEFVNHGGVVFKVYVAGRHVRCVKRKSLPDICKTKVAASEKCLPFSQISNLTAQDQSDASIAERLESAELPLMDFLNEVSREMRRGLGLNLFNFDMIRDSRGGDKYLVIDINYFPGYAKMPGYETMLTDFFLDIVQQREVSESV